jgi:hypothetical protein
MLDYSATVDLTAKPHQQSLSREPTPGLRDWRAQMEPTGVAAFEGVAGDLLAALGYEATRGPDLAGRLRLADYRGRTAAYRAASRALRRTPLWRRRHPVLSPARPRPRTPAAGR